MNDNDLGASTGISRRDAIKKGALVGGAVMWAVPAVQTVGNSAAWAQSAGTNGPADTLRIEVNGRTALCDLVPAGGGNYIPTNCREIS